jgi:hypothetical protein
MKGDHRRPRLTLCNVGCGNARAEIQPGREPKWGRCMVVSTLENMWKDHRRQDILSRVGTQNV